MAGETMRLAILTAVVVSRCVGQTTIKDDATPADTDVAGPSEPYCDGSATLDGMDLDPCENASARLSGVDSDGDAADWKLTFGTDDCSWDLDLDDVCGDGLVWFGGGADVDWDADDCDGPQGGTATGSIRITDYELEPDDDGDWFLSGTFGFAMEQDGVRLNGSVDVRWPVPEQPDGPDFLRCSNETETDQAEGRDGPALLDLLLVVDNSCSMIEEQATLASTLPALVDDLATGGVDFHIGVVTTDTQDPAQSGKLQAAGAVKVVTSTTPSRDSVLQQLIERGTAGSAQEQGLHAATLALSEPLRAGANAGFYRDEASLAIVVVSDEEDQSAPSVTKSQFIAALTTLTDTGKSVTFSSVVGPSPSGCSSSTADAVPGTVYLAVTNAIGGVALSICDTDWSGLSVALDAEGAGTTLRITPSEDPVAESLRVTAHESTGNRVLPSADWSWTDGQVLVPRAGFERGATVSITYAVAR